MLDKQYWDNRYLNDNASWDIGYASTPIKEYFDQVTNKNLKILIPGCGNAYEAEYLFNKGFTNVYLIDFSTIALSNFMLRVPNFPETHLICDDFFNHKEQYDIIVEQTFFCAIHIALRTKYAQHTAKLLNTNGEIIGLLFNCEFNTQGPPFGGNIKEYETLFKTLYNVAICQPAYNSIEPRKNRELFIKLIKK